MTTADIFAEALARTEADVLDLLDRHEQTAAHREVIAEQIGLVVRVMLEEYPEHKLMIAEILEGERAQIMHALADEKRAQR